MVIPTVNGVLPQNQIIAIEGTVLPSSPGSVIISIQDSPKIDNTSNVPMQMHLDFQQLRVYRNSFRNNHWGVPEEDGPFPFELGKKFLLTIQVQLTHFVVSVDGSHIFDFAYRAASSPEKYVNFVGQMSIDSVQIGSECRF